MYLRSRRSMCWLLTSYTLSNNTTCTTLPPSAARCIRNFSRKSTSGIFILVSRDWAVSHGSARPISSVSTRPTSATNHTGHTPFFLRQPLGPPTSRVPGMNAGWLCVNTSNIFWLFAIARHIDGCVLQIRDGRAVIQSSAPLASSVSSAPASSVASAKIQSAP